MDTGKIRYDHNDKCWVREILISGCWFLFYSPKEERLTDKAIKPNIEHIAKNGLPEAILQNSKYLPVEHAGYMHVAWQDFKPQTAGIVGGLPINWKFFLILTFPGTTEPGPPTEIVYHVT